MIGDEHGIAKKDPNTDGTKRPGGPGGPGRTGPGGPRPTPDPKKGPK